MSKFLPGTDPDYVNWFNVNNGFGGDIKAAYEYGKGTGLAKDKDFYKPNQVEAQTYNPPKNQESSNYEIDKVETPKNNQQESTTNSGTGGGSSAGNAMEGYGTGLSTLQDIMTQFFPQAIGADDQGGRAQKDAFALGFLQDYFNRQGSAYMAELDSALGKDNMRFGYYLNSMDKSNDRFENYIYGNMASDRAYERQNQFANQQYGRDMGMLAGVGEQTRANMQAQGVQDRLGYMTIGEQQRLLSAAQGHQDRLLEAAKGDQSRKTYDFQDRINARTEQRQFGRASRLARSF